MDVAKMAKLGQLRVEMNLTLSGTARASDLFYAKQMAKEAKEEARKQALREASGNNMNEE